MTENDLISQHYALSGKNSFTAKHVGVSYLFAL